MATYMWEDYKNNRYWIDTRKLIPPLGRTYNYHANVSWLRDKESKEINHDFGETYGQTEQEAYDRMKTKVEKWIDAEESS